MLRIFASAIAELPHQLLHLHPHLQININAEFHTDADFFLRFKAVGLKDLGYFTLLCDKLRRYPSEIEYSVTVSKRLKVNLGLLTGCNLAHWIWLIISIRANWLYVYSYTIMICLCILKIIKTAIFLFFNIMHQF